MKKQENNHNYSTGLVLFIDMNSFFATCEQQVNYYTRGKPVCVCVYTGKHGVIIAPSVEAKRMGIKLGMRLSEAIKICPDIIPVETHPVRYREFHMKIMGVLRQYSNDVIPKSIDEAIVDLTNYRHLHKEPITTAKKIKQDIYRVAGEWMKCSIGIAPNAFLAKLASNLQKPDGLVEINPSNIDSVLEKLNLTDLPGISKGMEQRFLKAGIKSPLEIRHASVQQLKNACKSIVGVHWHYRLNFKEVDQRYRPYKSMQARRAISKQMRKSLDDLEDLFTSLCLKLEQRMVKEEVYCHQAGFAATYENGYTWKDNFQTGIPIQDGMDLMNAIKSRIEKSKQKIINTSLTSMGISVGNFTEASMLQVHLFENNILKHNLRQQVYDIKNKYGSDKIMRAIELRDEKVLKDAIGFGSVKDMHSKEVFK